MLNEHATSKFVDMQEGGASLRIHFNDTGAAHPDAPVVVFLHGSGPGSTAWGNYARNVAAISSAGYRALLIDCPGWGRSDSIVCTASRSALNARVAAAVLDAERITRPVHVIGNSMGAHSAVAFTLSDPGRVATLVLCGGGAGSARLRGPTAGVQRLQAFYRDPTFDTLFSMLSIVSYDHSALIEPAVQARLDAVLKRRDHIENYVSSLTANPAQFPDVTERLGEIAAPTLVIWGREDQVAPLDVGLRMFACLRHAEMHIFSRCGHVPQLEHPAAFNRQVLQFLATL